MTDHPADPPSPLTAEEEAAFRSRVKMGYMMTIGQQRRLWATLDAARAPDAGLRAALRAWALQMANAAAESARKETKPERREWHRGAEHIADGLLTWIGHNWPAPASSPEGLTSTDQLEAEQRGLPIPYPAPAGPSVEDEARERAGEWNRHARWMADTGQSAVRSSPSPAGLDVERLIEALFRVGIGYRRRSTILGWAEANQQQWAHWLGENAPEVAAEYDRLTRAATRPAEDADHD